MAPVGRSDVPDRHQDGFRADVPARDDGLDTHFRRGDGSSWPTWQKVEYAVARAALFGAFIVVMSITPDQTAGEMAKTAMTVAMAIGLVELIFALRNRASTDR